MKLLLGKISETWAAGISLGSAFVAGATLVFMFGGFYALPAQVAGNEVRIQRLEEIVERLDILVCVITNEHVSRPVQDCVPTKIKKP
jgi:hypothetical protein